MVKVEIVDDKDAPSAPNSPYASSAASRHSSSSSLASIDDVPAAESLLDRLAALVDIVPPTTRYAIATRASQTALALSRAGKIAGNIVWVVTTSALLVGLPLALALEDEAKVSSQADELLAQQQGAQQLLQGYPGLPTASDQAKQTGIVPPGF